MSATVHERFSVWLNSLPPLTQKLLNDQLFQSDHSEAIYVDFLKDYPSNLWIPCLRRFLGGPARKELDRVMSTELLANATYFTPSQQHPAVRYCINNGNDALDGAVLFRAHAPTRRIFQFFYMRAIDQKLLLAPHEILQWGQLS